MRGHTRRCPQISVMCILLACQTCVSSHNLFSMGQASQRGSSVRNRANARCRCRKSSALMPGFCLCRPSMLRETRFGFAASFGTCTRAR